jgi:hypothetical protein
MSDTRDPITVARQALTLARTAVDGYRGTLERCLVWQDIVAQMLPAVDEARLPNDEARAALVDVRTILPDARTDMLELQGLLETYEARLESLKKGRTNG